MYNESFNITVAKDSEEHKFYENAMINHEKFPLIIGPLYNGHVMIGNIDIDEKAGTAEISILRIGG